jgi:hypothetical protein
MVKRAERDLYDWYATRLPKMLVRADGEFSVVDEELSWEQRALIAEEKLQSLVDGLKSEEAWDYMMTYNPLAVAIARTAIYRSRNKPKLWCPEHDCHPRECGYHGA